MTKQRSLWPNIRMAFWAVIALFVLGVLWTTRFGTRWPSIYDLVIFLFVDEEEVFHVLRRLAGLPGDTVAMEDGTVVVNGTRQSWPHQILEPAASWSALALTRNLFTWGPWIVPSDSVLLLADTRDMLGWPDSRFIGFVPQEDVIARATRRVTGRLLR
jgi:signal peptidase I